MYALLILVTRLVKILLVKTLLREKNPSQGKSTSYQFLTIIYFEMGGVPHSGYDLTI